MAGTAERALFLPDGDRFVATPLSQGAWDPRDANGGSVLALLAHSSSARLSDSDGVFAHVTVGRLGQPRARWPAGSAAALARVGVMTGRGRPRSVRAHQAVLEATRELLASHGYDKLTIEAIAGRAGVAKQTVYRWWPSKSAVVAEVALAGYLTPPAVPLEDTGDVGSDVRAWFGGQLAYLDDPAAAALIRALAAAAADSDAQASRLYDHLTGPSRQQLADRLRAGVERGQLRPDADPDAAADMLMGTLLFRALAGRPHAGSGADALVDNLLHGLATTPSGSGSGTSGSTGG